MAASLRSLLLAAVALLAALGPAPALAGLPTAVTDLLTCSRYAQVLQDGNFRAVPSVCQNETLAVVQRCVAESAKLCVVSPLQAQALTADLDLTCGLPPQQYAYVPALFRCGQAVQQLRSGNVPPQACQPEARAAFGRCLVVAARLGSITQAEASALDQTLQATCNVLPG